jgi:hypothetical protein
VSRRVLLAALVGVSALTAAATIGRGPGAPEDPVRRVVAFLGGKQSADFDGSLQLSTPQGATRDTRIRGKVTLPDRSVDLLGNDAITVIVTTIGDRVYEARGGMPSTYEVGPSLAGHSLNVWRPAELRQMLGRLEAATVADRTIRGRVPVSALVTTQLPGHVDVEVTIDGQGRPERLQWQMQVASPRTVEVRGDVTYKGWTARRADIGTPEEIENSPHVDEEQLAAYGHEVLAPTKLPAGYELTDLLLLEGRRRRLPRGGTRVLPGRSLLRPLRPQGGCHQGSPAQHRDVAPVVREGTPDGWRSVRRRRHRGNDDGARPGPTRRGALQVLQR